MTQKKCPTIIDSLRLIMQSLQDRVVANAERAVVRAAIRMAACSPGRLARAHAIEGVDDAVELLFKARKKVAAQQRLLRKSQRKGI